jgi:hypothetical protein
MEIIKILNWYKVGCKSGIITLNPGFNFIYSMFSIDQNLLYSVIVVIILLVLLSALIKWKKVRKTESEVKFPSKPFENNGSGDLESKCKIDEIVSPKQSHDELNKMNENTSNSDNKREYSHDSNEQLNSHEAEKEYKKLSKLLMDIEEKEKKLEKKNNEYKEEKHE